MIAITLGINRESCRNKITIPSPQKAVDGHVLPLFGNQFGKRFSRLGKPQRGYIPNLWYHHINLAVIKVKIDYLGKIFIGLFMQNLFGPIGKIETHQCSCVASAGRNCQSKLCTWAGFQHIKCIAGIDIYQRLQSLSRLTKSWVLFPFIRSKRNIGLKSFAKTQPRVWPWFLINRVLLPPC